MINILLFDKLAAFINIKLQINKYKNISKK